MVRRSIFARLFGRSKVAAEARGSSASTHGVSTADAGDAANASGSSAIGRNPAGRAGEAPGLRSAPVTKGPITKGPVTTGGSANRMTNGSGSGPGHMSSADADLVDDGKVKTIQVERVEGAADWVDPKKAWPDSKKGVKPSKLAPQEELSLKITEGISDLSGLLGRIDGKLADQNTQRQALARRLEALPRVLENMAETQKANLEATREIRRSMEDQTKAWKGTASSLQQMPVMMDGLGTQLEEHAKAGAQVKDSVEHVGKSVRSLADGSQRAQNTLLAEFRRAQDEHRRRLEQMVDRERRTFYTVAILGVAVVVCLLVVIARGQV